MIGSVAMMLEMSFGMKDEARNVWRAMQSVFEEGFSTPDLISNESAQTVSTDVFGDKVVSSLTDLLS